MASRVTVLGNTYIYSWCLNNPCRSDDGRLLIFLHREVYSVCSDVSEIRPYSDNLVHVDDEVTTRKKEHMPFHKHPSEPNSIDLRTEAGCYSDMSEETNVHATKTITTFASLCIIIFSLLFSNYSN